VVFAKIPHSDPDEPMGSRKQSGFFQFFSQDKEKNAGLSGILKKFNLGDIDTGDILLFLILILLLLEGDNWELVIILGLVLFLSLRSEGDAV
jgi:hypothetical protein